MSPLPARRLRWAGSWLIVVALLLKAAVPLLAATAARVDGVGLADVCSAYGVRVGGTPAARASTDRDAPSPRADHGCVLALLLASPPLPSVPALTTGDATQGEAAPGRCASSRPLPADACRRWLAGRLHAPPPRG